MNYRITSKDAPKIVLGFVLLLACAGFAMSKSRQARQQRENSETIAHMNREMGLPFIDTSQPKEQQTQEQDNQQEQASALQSASVVR